MYNIHLQGLHPVVLFYKLLLNSSCLNTIMKTHSNITVQQVSLLFLCYYTALHVSSLKAISRRYTLWNIFLTIELRFIYDPI
jgi:hypothetical protein